MRRFALAILAVILPILAGCSGSGGSGPVELEPLSEPAAQGQQEEEEPGGLSFIDRTVPVEAQEGLTYFAAATAPECPRVPVADQGGEKLRLDPAQAGFVTIVLFWGTNDPNSLGALQHVSELVHQYRRFRVRGVTIVGRTPGSDQAREFLDSRGVSMPVYWDDTSWSALRRMANTADAETPTAVPAIFILDRAGRVRLYRPGFRFTVQIEDVTRPGDSRLIESAPPGKRVVNYLERILREG
jgi:peroxiredoxin